MANNTIKTRIQLKNDTEANWDKAVNFVPREGEVIIYSADDTHPFSRLKVGDGVTNVIDLPFINSGSSEKVNHTLTFGNGAVYRYDGSQDVTVPVYTGGY